MADPYDVVTYRGYAFPQTHPDRLATIATLFGLDPAPVTACRVLELGCGDGGNLVPMALGLPGSTFVGVDLARRPVEIGLRMIQELGLTNIQLACGDVTELPEALGEFDYIVAHGLYSWVPDGVQKAILTVVRRHLAPDGIAYISYNTLPGGHLRRMVREMMLVHAGGVAEPEERIAQARAFLRFLSTAVPRADAYKAFLKEELEQTLAHEDASLFHDDLAPVNTPVYFFEFVSRAHEHGLQYLAEADYFEMQDHSYPPEVAEALTALSDNPVRKEQYLDFIKCRRFRQTLLCRSEVRVKRPATAEHLERMLLASQARRVAPTAAAPEAAATAQPTDTTGVVRFEGPKGAALATDHALAQSALDRLSGAWPRALPFAALADGADEDERSTLAEILLAGYSAGLLELRLLALELPGSPGERPVASPLARLQARDDDFVTTLRHGTLRLDDDRARKLVTLLDGTRDRASLAEALASEELAGEPLRKWLDESLEKLARLALLTR